MDAKDLMIGDWVLYKDESIMVWEIDEYYNRINTEPDGYNAITCIELSEVTPIPLTPEILEKNEFMFGRHEFKTRNDDYWISNDKRIILRGEDMTNSFNKWSVHVDTEDMRTMGYFEVTYVHELQHALRLYGIDKEITI